MRSEGYADGGCLGKREGTASAKVLRQVSVCKQKMVSAAQQSGLGQGRGQGAWRTGRLGVGKGN